MGELLVIVGALVAFGAGIWLLIVAFQESIWWGLGSLFLPFVSLVFAIMHWDRAGSPFLVSLAGTAVMFIGAAMSGGMSG